MFESIDKLMFAGLGAMSMTREKAEEIFDEYVKRGEAEKANKTGFVKDMMDHAEENRKKVEKIISDQVRQTIENLNLATKDDIARLEVKLNEAISKE